MASSSEDWSYSIDELVNPTNLSIFEEQSCMTREINQNVQIAKQETQGVSRNLEEVSEASLEASSCSERVLEAAQTLSAKAEILEAQISDFVSEINAG